MPRQLSTHAVAELVRVHPFTVAKWIDRGLLKAWRTAGGHRRVDAAEVRRFMAEREMPMQSALRTESGRWRVVAVTERRGSAALRKQFAPLADELELLAPASWMEAMLLAGESRPDAMLIDLDLEDVDALEVCRSIRARPSLSNVKLVAMSTRYPAERVAEALRAGAAAWLARPFASEALTALLPKRGGSSRSPRKVRGPCAIIGCPDRSRAFGYCHGHYLKRRDLERAKRLPAELIRHAQPQSVRESVFQRRKPKTRPTRSPVPAPPLAGPQPEGPGETSSQERRG